MRILIVSRTRSGGMAKMVDELAFGLRERGLNVDLELATWIPDTTLPKLQKPITERLRKLAKGYDVVHAFGYRAAWAVADALRNKSAWCFTAYHQPRSTHEFLIDRLSQASAGVCVSRSVYRTLDHAFTPNLKVIPPGMRPPEDPGLDRTSACRSLGLDPDRPVIAAIARDTPERGLDGFCEACYTLRVKQPNCQVVIAGPSPRPHEDHIVDAVDLGPLSNPMTLVRAANLLVVPSRTAGWSMLGLEAMHLGGSILLRDIGGLPEMIEDRHSGILYHSEEQLGDAIVSALQAPLLLESMGDAAKIRAMERFSLEHMVQPMIELYDEIA